MKTSIIPERYIYSRKIIPVKISHLYIKIKYNQSFLSIIYISNGRLPDIHTIKIYLWKQMSRILQIMMVNISRITKVKRIDRDKYIYYL